MQVCYGQFGGGVAVRSWAVAAERQGESRAQVGPDDNNTNRVGTGSPVCRTPLQLLMHSWVFAIRNRGHSMLLQKQFIARMESATDEIYLIVPADNQCSKSGLRALPRGFDVLLHGNGPCKARLKCGTDPDWLASSTLNLYIYRVDLYATEDLNRLAITPESHLQPCTGNSDGDKTSRISPCCARASAPRQTNAPPPSNPFYEPMPPMCKPPQSNLQPHENERLHQLLLMPRPEVQMPSSSSERLHHQPLRPPTQHTAHFR